MNFNLIYHFYYHLLKRELLNPQLSLNALCAHGHFSLHYIRRQKLIYSRSIFFYFFYLPTAINNLGLFDF